MIIKTIIFELTCPWGREFKTYNGWVYYFVNNDNYLVYEITDRGHIHIGTHGKDKVIRVDEKVL